jgi:DNA (cytosine-5)-methyltransferase 1
VNAVDLFAGAGGWSLGFANVAGRPPIVAVNHCAHAIRLHELNHPETDHFHEDIRAVDPAKACAGRRVDWLHLSPDCTHFSRAKGGKPRDQGIRGLAWCGVDWAAKVRPAVLSLENVAEFTGWGPLDVAGHPIKARAGETFREFVAELAGLGYRSEWRVLCAADFGAPTIRKRLFLIARCDGLPIRWPEPTHGPGRPLPWRAAAECIDWSIPCPSIFGRKRPLAPATCRRIAAGIVRYVLQGKPFLVETANGERPGQEPRTRGLDQPLWTVTGSGSQGALVAAFLAKHYGGVVGSDLRAPVGTVTSTDHHSLVAATLLANNTNNAPQRADRPLGTVTSGGRHALVAAFLTTYYQQGGTANRVDAPMPAVVTRARHGLVTVELEGETFVLADIGLRMLQPRELARAQGFPDSYLLEGSKAEQIARIGNSVVPQVAEAIVRANAGNLVRAA